MSLAPLRRTSLAVLALAAFTLAARAADPPAPASPVAVPPPAPSAPAPAPAPPTPPAGTIRNKVSAGDLRSAEQVLEAYRERAGEDGAWLVGYAWLARGALLLGEHATADRYNDAVYAECAKRVAAGTDLRTDGDVAYALGAAIEVRAQRLVATRSRAKAVAFVEGELARWKGTIGFRARLQKRIHLMTLEGSPAPELEPEQVLGGGSASLASLRGSPVVLYVWDKGCGDCRAQAPVLARVAKRYGERGVRLVGLTRRYEADSLQASEIARADSTWKATLAEAGTVPVVVSAASMERYGGSSTPTFVFVDRRGIVRRYTPTRLTEAELTRSIEELLR